LVLASKTGMYTFNDDGSATRGSGGVVTALASIDAPMVWVAAPNGAADRRLAADGTIREVDSTRLRFFDVDDQTLDGALNQISNPILWFAQHGMLDLLQGGDRRGWERSWGQYVAANRAYARTVAEELARSDAAPYAIIHDYQLYLTPGELRAIRPETRILHFTHIPWPAPEKWAVLGRPGWVRDICDSLLASDIVGFQTERDAARFVATAKAHLPGIKMRRDPRGDYLVTRRVGGRVRTTRIRHYPISIDPAKVEAGYRNALADGYPRQAEIEAYRRQVDKLVVRIDRLDPSKSTLEGFQAYRRLLSRRPDLHGKVGMMAILVPSRENVAEYAGYKKQVLALVDEINREYSQKVPGWEPIRLINENNYPRALALMGEADVLLVNSREDGMNLVSKEFAVVNSLRVPAGARQRRTPGVLLLSPTTGAWAELGPGSIAAGADPVQTAGALEVALAMKPAERRRRAAILSRVVKENPISRWTSAQVEDFLQLEPEKPAPLSRARPQPRPRASSPRAWARQIAAGSGKVLVALDIDGVLAPIVKQPDRARIGRKTRDALRRLAATPGVELAFITGRSADSAERMLNGLPGWRAVNHGLVLYKGGQRAPEPAISDAERTALDDFRGWIRENLPAGVRVEHKATSTAIHFRELDATDPAEAARLFDRVQQAAGGRANLAVREGRMVLEVGVLGHKDTALRRIARLSAAGTTTFAGDDVTDQPAIAAAASMGGVGLFVRSRETHGPPPGASGTLAGTRGVERWLTALADELAAR
ncbi:MAG TPA: trehalose-phosphatase, partial [Kofleriaceae bacterium]|nr:trehalose-phosphatase [Kofleriaceae bacterium]